MALYEPTFYSAKGDRVRGLFQTLMLPPGQEWCDGLFEKTRTSIYGARGFLSHTATKSMLRPGQFFQATFWTGDEFLKDLASSAKTSHLTLWSPPLVGSELGFITMVDEPIQLFEAPGTLSIIRLTTAAKIGSRIINLVRQSQEPISKLPTYGGSCLFSPTNGSRDIILLTWVHSTDYAFLARKFSSLPQKLERGNLLTVVEADLATHVTWHASS